MLGLLRINDLIDHRLVSLAKNAAAFFSRSRSARNNSFSRRNRANSFCMSSCGPHRRSVSRLSDIHRVKLEAVLDEELHRFAAEGPTDEELTRALALSERQWLDGTADFGGLADQYSRFACLHGDPRLADGMLSRLREITLAQVRRAATELLPEHAARVAYHADRSTDA